MSMNLRLIFFINLFVSSFLMMRVDIKEKRLPNKYMYPAILIALTINLIVDFKVLFSTFVVTLFFFLISLFYPKGMGFGDVKAILLIGLSLSFLGINVFIFSLGISFISASFFVIFARLLFKRKFAEFAFGPFLFIPAILLLGSHVVFA